MMLVLFDKGKCVSLHLPLRGDKRRHHSQHTTQDGIVGTTDRGRSGITLLRLCAVWLEDGGSA